MKFKNQNRVFSFATDRTGVSMKGLTFCKEGNGDKDKSLDLSNQEVDVLICDESLYDPSQRASNSSYTSEIKSSQYVKFSIIYNL